MTTPVRTTWVETIEQDIEQKRESYLETSHRIHATPEIGNEEFFASRLHAERLTAEGFTVELGVAGHDTAFFAKKSSDRPGATIAFLAEYDALPGIGHACGHNIIGTTSVAAAIALSKVLDEVGGSVVVLGTPAEEGGPNGSAKGSFVKHQLLEGIDAALMVHPSGQTRITGSSLAVDPLDFAFTGRPAHAAASPEEGINALDAVIQLFNGINALRQQLPDDVRIHGIITHGGDAPNIIPEYARARFFIRATTRERLNAVTEKSKPSPKARHSRLGRRLTSSRSKMKSITSSSTGRSTVCSKKKQKRLAKSFTWTNDRVLAQRTPVTSVKSSRRSIRISRLVRTISSRIRKHSKKRLVQKLEMKH